MKILLISPPAFTFKGERDISPLQPMGLGYLARVAESMGHEVNIIDCLIDGWNNEEKTGDLIKVGISDFEIKKRLKEFKPDLVGINCQFSRQYKIYHNIFSIIKEVNQYCIVVAGGAHVTVCPEEVLKDNNCDFVILGEGEETFRDLLDNRDHKNIDGFGYKKNGVVIINKKTKWINDLDSVAFPAYHLMGMEKYFGINATHGIRHKKRFSPVVTSRGCVAKCTFCTAHRVWGNKYRIRSIDNVIKELKLLKDKYSIDELVFEDDNVTANPKRAKELFKRMVGMGFVWDTPNGVGAWSIDEEMLDLMKTSGCVKVNFPVESGSQRVLNEIIKKPLKLDKIVRLTRHCKKIGLDYNMFLIVGLPGESLDEMWKSIRFARYCECYSPHISVATPYQGSMLFDVCKERGYFDGEYSLDNLFIRSFSIKTDEWDGKDVRWLLVRGFIYLKLSMLIHRPIETVRMIIEKLRNPLVVLRYLKKVV